jgi:hypothetical protein
MVDNKVPPASQYSGVLRRLDRRKNSYTYVEIMSFADQSIELSKVIRRHLEGFMRQVEDQRLPA